jgi:hypothetical protein
LTRASRLRCGGVPFPLLRLPAVLAVRIILDNWPAALVAASSG